jgi:hypothetical protein
MKIINHRSGVYSAALTILLAFSARGATNDAETVVLRFPNVAAWQFRPDIAVECANSLVLAGRESACDQLRQLADKKWEAIDQQEKVNRNICFICRLIFTSCSDSEPLRPPRLGGLQGVPYESMKPEAWPYLPFAITNEVPLSMTLGYMGAGVPERARNYLAYCISNGVFRATPFPMPTRPTASNALYQIILSPAWKELRWKDSGPGWSYSLDESDTKETLWQQVANITNAPTHR